jgi:hypothetical protein
MQESEPTRDWGRRIAQRRTLADGIDGGDNNGAGGAIRPPLAENIGVRRWGNIGSALAIIRLPGIYGTPSHNFPVPGTRSVHGPEPILTERGAVEMR